MNKRQSITITVLQIFIDNFWYWKKSKPKYIKQSESTEKTTKYQSLVHKLSLDFYHASCPSFSTLAKIAVFLDLPNSYRSSVNFSSYILLYMTTHFELKYYIKISMLPIKNISPDFYKQKYDFSQTQEYSSSLVLIVISLVFNRVSVTTLFSDITIHISHIFPSQNCIRQSLLTLKAHFTKHNITCCTILLPCLRVLSFTFPIRIRAT